MSRCWAHLSELGFGAIQRLFVSAFDYVLACVPSGRLGKSLNIIFSVFKTVCTVLRKCVWRELSLGVQHPLSRHHFELRHNRLVPRHADGKTRDGCLATRCVNTERQRPKIMCVSTERQRAEMMCTNHRDYARYHRDDTRFHRYNARYLRDCARI